MMSKPMAQVLDREPFGALNVATVVDYLVTSLGKNVQNIIGTGLLKESQCEALICYKVRNHSLFMVFYHKDAVSQL